MKINTNSWHFKVYRFFHRFKAAMILQGSERISLCRYFWGVILPPLLFLLFALALVAIFILSISTLWGSIGWWTTIVFPLAIIVPLLLINFIAKQAAKPSSNENPSFVKSYVRARKQKVCPILEFEERDFE